MGMKDINSILEAYTTGGLNVNLTGVTSDGVAIMSPTYEQDAANKTATYTYEVSGDVTSENAATILRAAPASGGLGYGSEINWGFGVEA